MAYVAVTGGKEAIEQSLELLKLFQKSSADLSITCIKDNMGLLIDKIMSEAGFYSQEYAALALKQSEGSVEEAVFLLRAYRSTLQRNYDSKPVDTGSMRLIRRISAAFKDIPGGQILGPTYDYSHRLLDFSLMEDPARSTDAEHEPACTEHEEASLTPDIICDRVTDLLRAEHILPVVEDDNQPPFDVTSHLLTFPAPRSARLQTFARSDSGFLGGVAYSSMRGYGAVHPTVSELRCGYVEVCIPYILDETEEICIGDILVTEVEALVPSHTETEEEFEQSRAFVDKVDFYETHIFKYSKRQGTKAAVMENQVPEQVKAHRSDILLALNEKKRLAYEKSFIGKEVEVLLEEEIEQNGRKKLAGHTKEYMKIALDADKNQQNCIVKVEIENDLQIIH